MPNGLIRLVHDPIKSVRRLTEVILSTPQPERLLLDRMFLAPFERDALPIAPIYRYWKLMIFAHRSRRHMPNGLIRLVHDPIKSVRRLMEVILSTPQPERLLLDRM